jgi:hypothetical protein
MQKLIGTGDARMSLLWFFKFFSHFLTICTAPSGEMHPAADRNNPPQGLTWYHQFITGPPTFRHKEFDRSMVGLALRSWNSTKGVTPKAWSLLSSATVYCMECSHMFSFDGFKAHTRDAKYSKCCRAETFAHGMTVPLSENDLI